MWVGWRAAMEEALYGASGFHRGGGDAARHLRASGHASARFAGAVASLLVDVDGLLRRPGRLDVVAVGGEGGRLLADLSALAPPDLRRRLRLTVVERGRRPPELAGGVRWTPEPPDGICGLVVANQWLDSVPVDVVELTGDGPRLVLVERDSGEERIGGRPAPADQAWLQRWWSLSRAGDRAEVGWPRDEAWTALTRRLHRGLAIAMDYGHFRHTRPPFGSLAGYWHGRQVPPVPDGACDIAAHVALDSCAGAAGSHLTTQRAALRALGLTVERPLLPQPAATPAGSGGGTDDLGGDPADHLWRLQAASDEAELTDPRGLGGLAWLVHANGIPVPGRLRAAISA